MVVGTVTARRRAARVRLAAGTGTALLAVLAVLFAGCAAGAGEGGQTSESHDGGVRGLDAQRVSTRCPRAVRPGGRAAGVALRTARRQLTTAFTGVDTARYRVVAVISLAPEDQAYGVRRVPYLLTAARRCGREAARRSLVVLFTFPEARSALVNPAAAYVARTAAGWRVWYTWSPHFGGRGDFVG